MPSDSPSSVETRTRDWLQDQYIEGVAVGVDPSTAVFGPDGEPRHVSRYDFQSLQRKVRIFRWLDRLRFESFLDVGSGFDYYPHLVRARYGRAGVLLGPGASAEPALRRSALGPLDQRGHARLARLPFATTLSTSSPPRFSNISCARSRPSPSCCASRGSASS